MATKKDLVEAYSFNRRRLVTAFVSGAPGGREVEPARPGRMVVGGAALAILLIAGAAIAGALTRTAPVQWDQPGLITDDHGALYVILEKDRSPGQPTLRPVINVTSAQLIFGAQKTRSVRDKDLDSRRTGAAIGILDAPTTVPDADQLIGDGWTSCTGTGQGLRTVVATRPAVDPTPQSGFLVTGAPSGRSYLVAEADVPRQPRRAYRYALPAKADKLVADVADAAPQDSVTVPDTWLSLIPEGGPLTAAGLGIDGLGRPAGLAGYPGALVGDLYRRADLTYAVTGQGLVPLTPFAEQVLRDTSLGPREPREVQAAADAPVEIVDQTFAEARWPRDVLDGVADATAEVCAVLDTAPGEVPAVRLATAPPGSALAAPVPAGTAPVQVASGRGALVRVGGFDSDTARATYLVDDRGRAYPIAGRTEIENLGYGGVKVPVVPDAWNRLFAPGPELSQLAALCPPTSVGGAAGPGASGGGAGGSAGEGATCS